MPHTRLKKPGDEYGNFVLLRRVPLDEIHCCLLEIQHKATGARILHIEADDEENCFCLSFQTTPESSNGVAHILEHTVLCGSEKFPVKDPFFSMTRRSLNTFMNAFTGADFTCYPAASCVPQDFYNLLDVYLDAVFKPHLRELSFMQEGHRLEFAAPEDPNSPLVFKGIVFNEMKGAHVSADSRLSNALNEALYPDLTYGFDSGGDPQTIPNLSYQELLDFHRKYYHPSRCLFYFYGNIPVERHLDFLEAHAFKEVKKKPPLPPYPLQPRFDEKRTQVISYPYSSQEDPQDKCLISFGFLTCHILDQETLLALDVLTTALFGTDAAPLKKALLKSGLCKQASAYFSDDYSEIPVVVTVKGCKEEDAAALDSLLQDKLQEIAAQGIPKELIESAIHQIEFHRTEITGDSLPHGLSLFMRCGLLKQHGGKPEDALVIHSLFEKLYAKLEGSSRYFEDLLKKYFINNKHTVMVIAKPDPALAAQEMDEERDVLLSKQQAMDSAQKSAILQKAKELAALQEEQEAANVDVLPKLALSEVSLAAKDYPLKREEVGGLQLFRHEAFTNQIVYAALVFPIPKLEENELSLFRLFTTLLPQLGCGGRTYEQNLEYIQAVTGGVAATETLNTQAADASQLSPYLALQGKALYRNANQFFSLLKEMAESVNFRDKERIKELLVKHFAVLSNNLNRNALRYATNLAASSLAIGSRIANAWGGIEYYGFIRDTVQHLDHVLDTLIEQLAGLQQRVLGLQGADLVLTADSGMCQHLHKHRYFGLQEMAFRSFTPWQNAYSLPAIEPQGRVISSPVAFTSHTISSKPYTDPAAPYLTIAAHLFDNVTLHQRIREQGGAYGGGAMNNALSGNFCFYAYRDPNIVSSLEAFHESVQRIAGGGFTDDDIEEAKLEIIQGMDAPVSPGSRGVLAYSWLREGRTYEKRQRFRDTLIQAAKEDIRAAVETHILPQLADATTVVFAGEELLAKENEVLLSKGMKPLLIKSV